MVDFDRRSGGEKLKNWKNQKRWNSKYISYAVCIYNHIQFNTTQHWEWNFRLLEIEINMFTIDVYISTSSQEIYISNISNQDI